MKLIKLTQGKEAIVDDEDYEYLNKFKWYYHNRGYACTYINKKLKLMHRVIIKSKLDIDHINLNGLDNRKENLRPANKRQNMANSKKMQNKTSKYKGVFKRKTRKTSWLATIKYNKKAIYLGSFKEEKDAARAYNEAAIKYFGEFARINDV